jgi:hypothetical protein
MSGAQATATPGWRVAAAYPSDWVQSVSASDASNAWAVGVGGGCCDLLVSHWDGKRWVSIGAPGSIGGGWTNQVGSASVAALPGGRAMIFVTSTDEELGNNWVNAFEWKGRSWTNVVGFNDLPGNDAIASGLYDVWGFDGGSPSAEHLSGSTWSEVSTPVVVSGASGNAAAGDWITGAVAAQPKVVQLRHWSTGAWRNAVLPKIAVPTGDQMFPGTVDAATLTDIWVTLSVGPSAGRGTVTAYLLHWNGKAWSKAAVSNGLNLLSLAGDGHGGAWLTTNHGPLVMYHYSGGRWTHVPAPASATTSLTGGMGLIPGTQSVLAPVSVPVGGAVLKYGP